jgi:hypothetical protein
MISWYGMLLGEVAAFRPRRIMLAQASQGARRRVWGYFTTVAVDGQGPIRVRRTLKPAT